LEDSLILSADAVAWFRILRQPMWLTGFFGGYNHSTVLDF